MLDYLKDRFKEYMTMSFEFKNKSKEIASTKVPKKEYKFNQKDQYIDYEIYYGGTTILIDTFSMSKQELETNFKKTLITSISDALDTSIFNIKLVSGDLDTILCDITYSGKHTEYIRHEIKKLKNTVFEFDPDDYMDSDDDHNPYEGSGWNPSQWHCMRCGDKLLPIEKDDKEWDYAWSLMKADGTQWFLCSNQKCEDHYNSPLILHHPYNTHSEASESYSISHLL